MSQIAEIEKRMMFLKRKKIKKLSSDERNEFISLVKKQHDYYINNPKVNKGDDLYKERMILLVKQKSNWHLYYDPLYDCVMSIAVVPQARSSSFGNVSYFKRWFNYKKRNSKNTMLCLTNKAVELIK